MYVTRTKHPAAAMLLGVVASTGETAPPVWFPQGFRLDAAAYVKVLEKTIVPWMRAVAAEHGPAGRPAPFVFQQDSAPAHKAKKTLDFLRREKIPFWPPSMWPPNSPDLAPLDYGIWPLISSAACRVRAGSVPIMKRRMNAAWRHADQEKIRGISRKFRPRLEEMLAKNGSIIE